VVHKSNTEYTNRYGDKYWWEKLEDAVEIIKDEQEKDKEGLPRVVWECE